MSANDGNVSLSPSPDFHTNWAHVSSTNSTNLITETPFEYNFPGFLIGTADIPVIVELILAAIGVLANSLVVYVIARYPEMRTVPNVFVLNIALADLLWCCGVVPLINTYVLLDHWIFGKAMCKITSAFFGICYKASILFIVAMSIERYQAVSDPIRHHQRSSKKRTWLISAGLWLVSVIFTTDHIVFTKFETFGNKFARCFVDSSSIVQFEDYMKGLRMYEFVVWFILPLTILVPCYAGLYYKLHHGDVTLAGSSSTTVKSRNRVTRMVTVVVAVFVVSWMPVRILYVVNAFYQYNSPVSYVLLGLLLRFVEMLATVNSMVNPFLYALLSDKFRVYMKKVLFCGRGVDKRMSQSGSTPRSCDTTRPTQRTV